MDIEISQRSQAKMQIRHLYEACSSLPSGTPEYWNRLLKGFDPHLSLRLAHRSGRFLIFYDIHGELSVIRSFGQNESFSKAFLNVKHNSLLRKRELVQMRKELDEAEQKRQDYLIDQCGEEIGAEVHQGAIGKVINDTVDAYAPEKPSLGGVMI